MWHPSGHQTKSQELLEDFHSLTDIIFQFKFRLWLFNLLNCAIDSDIKVLNWEGDRLNYHPLPCSRLNWHTLHNQWEDRKCTWNIIKHFIYIFSILFLSCMLVKYRTIDVKWYHNVNAHTDIVRFKIKLHFNYNGVKSFIPIFFKNNFL